MDKQPGHKAGPFRTLHLISTLWFVGCTGHVLLSYAIQARLPWWAIFSLSGYSVVLVFMFLSLYLFVIFRGTALDLQLAPEHPLTSSLQYTALYTIVPFLGGITGCLSGIELQSPSELAYRASLGTFVATFAGWVILDPAIGILEGILPPGSRYRAERLAKERAARQAREVQRQRLLAQVLQEQQAKRQAWLQQIQEWTEELSGLMKQQGPEGVDRFRQRVIQIGIKAWQIGGIACMQEIYDSIKRQDLGPLAEYIEHWWDGIGAWKGPNA